MDISLQNTESILSDRLDTPVQSNVGELFRIQNTLQNIDTAFQHIDSRIRETQEEVESVESDVKDIDDKVEDLETNTITTVNLSKKIYEATEKMINHGAAVLFIVSIVAATWKHIQRVKDKDSFKVVDVQKQNLPQIQTLSNITICVC